MLVISLVLLCIILLIAFAYALYQTKRHQELLDRANYGDLQSLKVLLARNNDQHVVRGYLDRYCEKGNVEAARIVGDDLDGKGFKSIYTAKQLKIACIGGHFELFKYLIEKTGGANSSPGTSWSDETQHDLTPLMMAAKAGRLEFVKWLVNQGADTSVRTVSAKERKDQMDKARESAAKCASEAAKRGWCSNYDFIRYGELFWQTCDMTACDLALHFGQQDVVAWLTAQMKDEKPRKNGTKISAKEVLNDLKAAMNDKELMAKYAISEKQLMIIYQKLAESGYLKGRDF
jgi:hypothetical protein